MENQTLIFNGNSYNPAYFTDEVKATISGIQTAEQQMKLFQDNLSLLSVANSALIARLGFQLKDVEPLPETDAPADEGEE